MANVIKKTSNRWTKGLIMDFSPENTKNEVLSNALNATLLTFNGNELSLQNDMGNARVETAYLPEGYMPVGTCEYGGIIYIVSYNPLENKSQIGCFPSPERNISSDELGQNTDPLAYLLFLKIVTETHTDATGKPVETSYITGELTLTSYSVLLKLDNLNPGDKFIITANDSIYNEAIKDMYIDNTIKENPIIALNIVSIEDSGKIIYLNSDVRLYKTIKGNKTYKYNILGSSNNGSSSIKTDIDSYRNAISSGYSVFKSKTSGKLAILAELIMIDSYSVTHSVKLKPGSETEFDVIIHTDVSPKLDELNYFLAPKLKYYYLSNSLGYMQTILSGTAVLVKLFSDPNYNLYDIKLNDIYENNNNQLFDKTLREVGNFDFPLLSTYHGRLLPNNETNFKTANIYTKFFKDKYHKINKNQIKKNLNYFYDTLLATIYKYVENPSEEDLNYTEISKNLIETVADEDILFIVVPHDSIIFKDKFIPDFSYNYIKDIENNDSYPQNDPIEVLIIADFLPVENELKNFEYEDVKLASIKIPELVINNGLDLPFKYDYTIVPCMNYGRLDHLAVSNTVDFSKLHAFNQSGFHTWKYYIENGLLRLTLGADVYDTYEELKVDGIILEFYDLWGYAGTLEITDKKSYSGIFTKIIPLNTANVLINKKIIDNYYSDLKYVRNIEITNNDSIFKYKDFIILHNDNTGWKASDTSKIIDNDCGTLYSNIIYGVKAYFRRKTTDGNYQFIHKQNFFLYTLPLFNDYYNSLLNFDTITNPELKFVLTYKLLDSSNRSNVNSTNILNGYNTEDSLNLTTYLNGNYPGNTLEVTKYYNYNGTSKLLLEIGLNEEYGKINLCSDPTLNNYYKCKLRLISNNDESVFNIESSNAAITNPAYILNYNTDFTGNNSLKFENNSNILELENIKGYNFISDPLNTNTINIRYSFDIGYNLKVLDIIKTLIPATTICALFHQNLGVYNYGDFGIYETTLNGQKHLLSNVMVFTSGHTNKGILGICRLKGITGKLNEQCVDILNYETTNVYYNKPFDLYSGEILENITPKFGKLMFCAPHVHGSPDGSYLCNLTYGQYGEPGVDKLSIPTHHFGLIKISNHDSDSFANYPKEDYFNFPYYNMYANTLDSIKYKSEFISALDFIDYAFRGYDEWEGNEKNNHKWTSPCYQPYFEGFTGELLVTFNTKLLKTMSSIYAYNPDYDILDVNTGKTVVQDYFPIFTSNIINTYSEFNEDILLNDFININSISISKYLLNLTSHSNIATYKEGKPLNLVNFIGDFEYCGTEASPYLITSLTYKAPIPEELLEELRFDRSNKIILKHSEGNTLVITGIFNKKALYGYDPTFNKLVTLDISNYTIEEDGALKLNYLTPIKDADGCKIILKDSQSVYNFITNKYKILGTIGINFKNASIGSHFLFELLNYGNSIYLIMSNPSDFYSGKVIIDYAVNFLSHLDKCSLEKISWSLAGSVALKDITFKYLDLTKESLDYILSYEHKTISINGSDHNLEYINDAPEMRLDANSTSTIIECPKASDALFIMKLQEPLLNINYKGYENPAQETFLNTAKTFNYADMKDHKYRVKGEYDDARIKGTSLTINDLIYEPNVDGHRLFIKNDLYEYTFLNTKHKEYLVENKICYRLKDWGGDMPNRITGELDYNDLYMATGPCFTSNTL